MKHDTAIGRLFSLDPELGRAEIIECSRRNDGNLVRMAHELGIHRRWLYRLIYRWDLWDHIDSHRAQKKARAVQTPEENWLGEIRKRLSEQ